uniref:RRM domain-containing protein n=1 Tax=Anopheles farauti TaxID=69004 RepID=A0A182QZN0_9DIPT
MTAQHALSNPRGLCSCVRGGVATEIRPFIIAARQKSVIMATVSGKKGKKPKKNNKLSLGEFLTDGNTGVLNQVQVAVPVKLDWGDDGDDDDDDRVVRTQVIALPTAPRASRILNDDSIPQNPPFSIYVSNLPYDINEDDLYDIFENVDIVSMTLPRDDGDSRRLRGFGNIEFATRNDLIEVLAKPEPMVRNRRIRIGLFNENDNKRRNNRYDNFGGGDSERPSAGGNWRDRPESAPRPMDRERPDYGLNRRPYSSGGYGGGMRDRDGDRERSSGDSGGGNWRSTDRPAPLSPNASRRFDRDSIGGGFRRAPDGGPRPMSGLRRDPDVPMERPKLVLQPRTLPLPKPRIIESDDDESEQKPRDNGENVDPEPPRPRPTPVPAAKVFGDAKPVDTAAREREIEERLRLEQEERKREQAAAEEKVRLERQALREAEQQNTASDAGATTEGGGADGEEGKPSGAPDGPQQPIVNWRVRSTNATDEQKDDRRTDNRGGTNRSTHSNGRDYRDHDRTERGGRDRAYPPRDSASATHRNGEGGKDHPRRADVAPTTKPAEKEPRESKPIEERMPKFQEPTGPNLSMKNTFEGLSADEIDD